MINLRRAAIILGAFVHALPISASAEDWPHWRGPSRNSTTSEVSGWDGQRWLEHKPVWSKSVGIGSTSPVIAGGKLYVLGWRDNRDVVQCLDAATGEKVWSQSYACPRYGRKATGDEGLYAGPSSTPEFDPQTKHLFTLSTDGHLHCWDTARGGERVWGLNLYDEFDAPRRPKFGRSGLRDYGYTSSPLMHGSWLLVEVGDDTGSLMAFDKATAKLVWKSQAKGPAGHNGGPVPIAVEGVPCVALLTCERLLIIRLDQGHEGRTIGEFPWATDFANNIATPTVAGSDVLITTGYNHASICKLRASLAGLEKVWEQPYASLVGSPVVYQGSVYIPCGKLRCLDLATGTLRWEGGRWGDDGSCLATSDGRLILWGRDTLGLCEGAERSPAAYRELARLDNLSGTECWPHVVLAAGRVYCKDRAGSLHCFRSPLTP